MVNQRIINKYSDDELLQTNIQKNIFNSQLELMKHKKLLNIYDNQAMLGKQIFDEFTNLQLAICLIIAPTQSGKTGSMVSLISEFINNDNIDVENIYVITGISSIEWRDQTIQRFPESLKNNILHRNDLIEKFKNIQNVSNSLIIIDEIHYACKENQALFHLFQDHGLFDLDILYKHNIKIVQYSATPDGVVYDINKWENACKIIIAGGGDNYVSNKMLLDQEQVIQYKNLHSQQEQELLQNIKELKSEIDAYTEPKYHIIRTKSGKEQGYTITNISLQLIPSHKYIIKTYDGDSKFDLNELLAIKPKKHTLIFIKEMLRCAKTLDKQYIGILYERHTKVVNSSAIIQGLLGRATGYDSNKNIKIFTDIPTIENYNILLDNNFNMDFIDKWQTNSTTAKGKSKGTINSAKNFKGVKTKTPEVPTKPTKKAVIKLFDIKADALAFIKTKFGESSKMPKEPTLNNQGFYISTIRAQQKVRSVQEIKDSNIYGVGAVIKFKLYYAYQDITNKDTLTYMVCCLD